MSVFSLQSLRFARADWNPGAQSRLHTLSLTFNKFHKVIYMYFFAYFPFLTFSKASDEYLRASQFIAAAFYLFLGFFQFY